MFLTGIFVLVVSVVFIVSGVSAKRRGDLHGGTLSLVGKTGIVAALVLLMGSAVRVIGPGEVGVVDLFGKVYERELHSGVNLVNPLVNVHVFSIKTREMQETMNVPSKEGLQVDLDVSILYKMKPDAASEIFRTIGEDYANIIILPSFRSAARSVSVLYDASALYTESREVLAKNLFDRLKEILDERGIILERVLLRSIRLPETVTQAIEDKLKAEQEAQKMTFVLERERLEAERRKVEAGGIKTANAIIAESLSPEYIQWYRIEMLKELVNSPNNTIIIIPDDLKGVPLIMNK